MYLTLKKQENAWREGLIADRCYDKNWEIIFRANK